MRNISILLLVFITLFSCKKQQENKLENDYLVDLTSYRDGIKDDHRVEYLKLVGRYTLPEDEAITFGSGDENSVIIKVSGFPERAGNLRVTHDSLYFKAWEELEVTDEQGIPVDSVRLPLDQYGRSTLLTSGRFSWRVMEREGNFFIRIRDENNPAVESFKGYEWFEPDAKFIFNGKFEYYETSRVDEVPSVFEFRETEEFIGKVTFDYNGESYSLDVGEGGFLMFIDSTTGNETYGAGRYLDMKIPETDGPVVLDFNYAYNPPCIFSRYTTCKFAPIQNRLSFGVKAGETAQSLDGAEH